MNAVAKYQIEDYTGKTINYLTVRGVCSERSADGSLQWEFQCVCGKTVFSPPARVISGHKKSCGCMKYSTPEQLNKKKRKRPPTKTNVEEYIGRTNEKLTVFGYERPEGKGRLRLKCKCECGNTVFVLPYQFDKGRVKSCGCARFGHSDSHKGIVTRRTHGLSKNRFYKKWNDMVRRCHNPKEPAYKFYGALGISVCEEWRHSPEEFIKWCETTHPDGERLTIDRIDGTKGYSPDNCRWITQIEQVHNLKNNRFITIENETHCITEWCRLYNLSAGSIYKRTQKGQSFEQAISELIALKSAPIN